MDMVVGGSEEGADNGSAIKKAKVGCSWSLPTCHLQPYLAIKSNHVRPITIIIVPRLSQPSPCQDHHSHRHVKTITVIVVSRLSQLSSCQDYHSHRHVETITIIITLRLSQSSCRDYHRCHHLPLLILQVAEPVPAASSWPPDLRALLCTCTIVTSVQPLDYWRPSE